MEKIALIIAESNDNYVVCYEGDEKCLSDMYSVIKEEIENSFLVLVDKNEYLDAKNDIQKLNEFLKISIQ